MKYHVSEILSKLGLSSREEAAAWSSSERRPWWMSAFAPIGFIWEKTGRLLAVGVLAAAGAGLVLLAVLLVRSHQTSDAMSEDEVWHEVVSRTAANISPILRPTYVPQGFDTITLLAPTGPGYYFRVEYRGQGKSFQVEVSKYNLPLPALPANQELVNIRGLACNSGGKGTVCFWQTSDPLNPTAHMWLAWSQPGTWRLPDQPQKPLSSGEARPPLPGPVQDSVEYLLSAEGLTKQEVLDVAEGMTLATDPS